MGSVAIVAALALGGCGDDGPDEGAASTAEIAAGPVTIGEAWSRQPAAGQVVTAVYAVVANHTEADITIVAASTSVTERVELHETVAGDDGTMTMRKVAGGFVVPAGGEFVFESGGPHVMLFDIDAETYPTDSVSVTLEFDSADPITFDAEVRELPGADVSGEMDHDMSGGMDDG